jgi:cytochrome b6
MDNIRYALVLRRFATLLSIAILTVSVLAAISGILIAFYYQPSAGGAYQSLKYITTQVPYGAVVRSLHNIAGNSAIILGLLQIVVMFLGQSLRLGWFVAWISGILFTLSAIGLSWTAMILSWSQVGYWRFRIELGTIEAIPFIGSGLRDILTGGVGVSTLTVEHLYSLHSYVLSFGAITLAIVHLIGMLRQTRDDRQVELSQTSNLAS